MTIIAIIGIWISIVWVIRLLAGAQKIDVRIGAFALHVNHAYVDDARGNTIAFARIAYRGSLNLPETSTSAVAKIRIMDVTDPDTPLPVRSLLHGTLDAEGMFYHEVSFTVPNGTYQFSDTELVRILLEGLHAPYRGARKFDVHVQFTAGADDTVYTDARQILHVLEERPGYIEAQQLVERAEAALNALAHFVASIDDTTSIEQLDAHISEVLDIDHGIDMDGMLDDAYERCVVAATTARRLTSTHVLFLAHIARRLGLPSDIVAKFNDRHLRIWMMEETNDEASIGMPSGLTVQQKLEFLTAEYRKWRARATHADPVIAAEATARLDVIARARASLTPDGT